MTKLLSIVCALVCVPQMMQPGNTLSTGQGKVVVGGAVVVAGVAVAYFYTHHSSAVSLAAGTDQGASDVGSVASVPESSATNPIASVTPAANSAADPVAGGELKKSWSADLFPLLGQPSVAGVPPLAKQESLRAKSLRRLKERHPDFDKQHG